MHLNRVNLARAPSRLSENRGCPVLLFVHVGLSDGQREGKSRRAINATTSSRSSEVQEVADLELKANERLLLQPLQAEM
jgi:hypothetical protein